MAQPSDLAVVRAKLPTDKTPEQRVMRRDLFRAFDPNGNGYLSLAEVDRGLLEEFSLHELFDAKPVIIRAFNAAKAVNDQRNGPGSRGPDYVERVEFRFLLVYLERYLELWEMFRGVDSSGDGRITPEEFRGAISLLEGWGIPIIDADATFKEMDSDEGGMVLFEEFSSWVIEKALALVENNE